MLIDEILNSFETSGPRGHYQFETFILNLLKFHVESQGKKLSLTENSRAIGDALVENGFDEFIGKTLIEIKSNLGRIPSRILFEQLIFRLARQEEISDLKNILLINSRQISPMAKRRIIEEFNNVNPSLNVEIWGPEELNKIVSKHRKQTTIIANNLFSLRLENAVSKITIDWEKERDARLKELIYSYERGQFAFFLGAGVSSSAGMPDWNTLLNSLFVSYLAKEFTEHSTITLDDIKEIVQRLNQVDEPSALMSARYLRKGFSKERSEFNEFTKSITKNLYQLRNTNFQIDSNLIKSISNLCMPKRTGAKVRSVVTYNFDDLIERQLKSNSIQHHSIFSENEYYHPDELPIYHVHGFLPENPKQYDGLEKSTLVFSEEGYHQIYSDSYHWSNLVQLNNLREYSCLMVGLSMTDPNLRRLLDISARNLDKPRHFAFMRRITTDKFIYSLNSEGKKVQHIKSVKSAEEFLEKHHTLNEEIMKELGVTIIWFTDFEEIPKIINSLAKKS